MARYNTANIEAMINEMVIGSFEAFQLLEQGEEAQAAKQLEGSIKRGYFLSEVTLDILKEYAKMKDQYTSFEDFVPVILSRYEAEAKVLQKR